MPGVFIACASKAGKIHVTFEEKRMMIKQRTLRTAISATGIGLHSGEKVKMKMLPADADTGIVFRRTDMSPVQDVKACAFSVGQTQLSSTLINGDAKVDTVEHLMAALAGLGIDNAIIEVDAPEVPIMDGSSSPFVFLIQSAGIQELSAAKKFIQVLETVTVKDGDKLAQLSPYAGFKMRFEIDFNHPVFDAQKQDITINFNHQSFVRDISRARTFGFVKDLEFMRANNLALGGNLDNAIVVDDFRILNEDGFRYEDEFVKHKVLDAIGDLYLAGHSILGEFYGVKSGHALNNDLVRHLIETESAWEFVEFESLAEQQEYQDYLGTLIDA